MPGHDGSYPGVVVDDRDPTAGGRVLVEVPAVRPGDPAWALPGDPTASTPAVGDTVTVRFEGGDENHPVYTPGYAESDEPAGGYAATYAGLVVANDDPDGYRRIAVQVPAVGPDTRWALPEDPDAALPAVGDQVWVRFENGDPEHPVWSGGSGTGTSAGDDGPRRAIVLSAQDPDGLGRLFVQVAGAADGVWAEPADPPPAVGAEVTVHYADGVPVWSR